MTDVDGTLYLTAFIPAAGKQALYKTLGAEATTELVTAVTTGPNDAEINTLVPFDDRLFFFARNDALQGGLYITDGTSAGTSRLANVNAAGKPLVNGDLLYFLNNGGVLGYELWISDGTGISLVKDINPGLDGSFVGAFASLDSTVVMIANDGVHGTELWRTDGAESGTVLVKDIRPGSASSFTGTTAFTQLGDALLFAANDGVQGFDLWRTDGTETGTWLVKNLNIPNDPSKPSLMTRVGDLVYFTCFTAGPGYDLWKTDGTEAGTELVANFGSDDPLPGARTPTSPVAWQGIYYCLLYNDAIGTELWRSDGTEEGTFKVARIWPEIYPQPYVNSFSALGPLLFPGYSPESGVELFRSDGTTAGTLPVEIMPGPGGSAATTPAASGGLVYFPASNELTGLELWAVPASELVFPTCVVDLNGDGLVDFADYLEFLNLFDAQDPRVDFNQDELIDFADYLEFLNLFDAGC